MREKINTDGLTCPGCGGGFDFLVDDADGKKKSAHAYDIGICCDCAAPMLFLPGSQVKLLVDVDPSSLPTEQRNGIRKTIMEYLASFDRMKSGPSRN